jgi:hypothetical protein
MAHAQEANIVTNFLENTNSLENTEYNRPITEFITVAETTAAKKSELTKENIEQLLTEARSYKYVVVTTGRHTLVKITHLDQCLPSGSWGTCIPYGEGYISRQGLLEFKQDHLNNIIGVPGSQSRMIYFFN